MISYTKAFFYSLVCARNLFILYWQLYQFYKKYFSQSAKKNKRKKRVKVEWLNHRKTSTLPKTSTAPWRKSLFYKYTWPKRYLPYHYFFFAVFSRHMVLFAFSHWSVLNKAHIYISMSTRNKTFWFRWWMVYEEVYQSIFQLSNTDRHVFIG